MNRFSIINTNFHLIFIFFIILLTSIIIGCGSKISGEVNEKYSNQPIYDVTISATTSTDIAEDKKYERRNSKSNKLGKFIISGLSPKYNYRITAKKDGYFSMDGSTTYVSPPDEGKTKILRSPLTLIKKRKVKGTIVDRFKSNPIPNALIYANVAIKWQRKKIEQNIAFLNSSSDEQGSFEIGPFYPNFDYLMKINKDGYACSEVLKYRNNSNQTNMDDLYLLELPRELGVYLVKVNKNFTYERIELTSINFKPIDIKWGWGLSGGSISKKYYVTKEDFQEKHIINSDMNDYLLIYFNKNTIKKDLYIVPLKYYEELPVKVGYGENVLEYFNQKNIYLYATKNNSKVHIWNEINIKSFSHEIFISKSNEFCVYLVPLNNIEKGIYLFTINHGSKWLFTKI